MDQMMPKMDGIETTKNLREAGYNYPIIALTANAVTGQQEIFLSSGFDGYISKPIDLRQLDNALNKFIRDKKHERKNSFNVLSGRKAEIAVDSDNQAEIIPSIDLNIPGIDARMGLALYMNNMDIYISVLRSFVPNVLSNIENMRDVSEESLPDYAVYVHGMKSISANIGAEKLRSAALNLENMAKDGDLAGVLAQNKKFLMESKKAAANVQAWLEKYDTGNSKPQLESPDKDLLASLCKYCEVYDMNEIDDIMDKLESVNYKSNASLVKWLREKINNSDFSSVTNRLSEYLKG
jgi:CheY-like chemotaxis protein